MTTMKKDQIQSRTEVVIPITLRGLWKGLEKITIEAPMDLFAFFARKTEALSQVMMTGHMALVSMPLGLMLRNGSRVTHSIVEKEGRNSWGNVAAATFGFVGAAGAWWLAGNALAGTLATTTFGGAVGGIGTFIAAAIISSPVMLPAAGVSIVGAGLVFGAATTVLSLVPAVANIGVGFNRMIDAWKGVKYDEKALKDAQEAFKKGSSIYSYEQRKIEKTHEAVYRLPTEERKKLYESLSLEFQTQAQPAAAAPNAQAPKADNNGKVPGL